MNFSNMQIQGLPVCGRNSCFSLGGTTFTTDNDGNMITTFGTPVKPQKPFICFRLCPNVYCGFVQSEWYFSDSAWQ